MTSLRDIQVSKNYDELFPRITRSITSGKYAVGHFFFENNNLWYCFQVPDNNEFFTWQDTVEQAITVYQKNDNALDKEVFNPF